MRPQARKFGGMFKKRMNEGGLTDEEKAAKYRGESKSLQSPDVPPSKKNEMRNMAMEAAQRKASGKAFDKAITTPETKDLGKGIPVQKHKQGGRVRRYAEGGEADDATMEQSLTDSKSFGEAFRAARSGGDKTFTYRGKQYNTEMRSDKPTASKASTSTATSRTAEVKDTSETNTGAMTGRASPLAKKAPSAEQKEENARRLGEIGMGAMSAIPAVRGAQFVARYGSLPRKLNPMMRGPEGASVLRNQAREAAGEVAAKETARKAGMAEAAKAAANKRDMGYREGGKVKEAAMEMRHAKAMKKAGLPKSMVREEMAEAKKYARGGGIESRGRTKGTVIKMASGGSVSARADGCVQRGKTKGRMV